MLGATLNADDYLKRLQSEVSHLDTRSMNSLSELVFQAWDAGRFVFVIGNGGSGTTATHVSEDFGKSLLRESDLLDESKKRLKVMSLTDNVGWILAVGNDVGYDQIFQQQLMNYGSKGDLVVAISGSGNSPNILRAVEWAKRHELHVFGLTGFDGGQLIQIQDEGIHAPLDDMGMVESLHLCALHWVLDDVFARINGCDRYAQESSPQESILT